MVGAILFFESRSSSSLRDLGRDLKTRFEDEIQDGGRFLKLLSKLKLRGVFWRFSAKQRFSKPYR
jgi:hypothetical protein